MAKTGETVAELLVRRVTEAGRAALVAGGAPSSSHFTWFGVPGDYSFPLNDAVPDAPGAVWAGEPSELTAGYAADGYGRIAGLGAVMVTYSVGELSVLPAVAGAFAERVPVVVVASSPAVGLQAEGKGLMHHSLMHGRPHLATAALFDAVTCARSVLTASNAASDIDRLLSACAREQQPVHFAVPLDVQTAVAHTAATAVTAATAGAAASAPSPAAAAAARAVASALASAARPVLLAGPWARLPRAPLAWGPAAPPPPPLQALAETANLPLAVLPSARGQPGYAVSDERHPSFLGIYAGVRSSPAAARSVVEASDCVVAVGWLPAETDTGGWTATLGERGPPPRVRIDAEATHVAASSGEETQTFAAPAADVLRALAAPGAVAPRSAVQAGAYWAPGAAAAGAEAAEAAAPWPPAPGAASTDVPLTGDDAEATLQALLRPGDVLVVETMALAKASCSSLRLPTGVVMLRQSLFGSIGWALPAAGGACRAAAAIVGPGMGGPGAGRRRVVVATGDGSLQMTAQALGPMLRDRLAPVVLLVDNGGYLIERLLCSRPFAVYNEVPAWDHELLPLALGGAAGSVAVVSASSRGQLAGFVTGVADAQAGGRLAWGVLHTPRDSFPSGSAAIGPGARIMAAGVVGGPL